MQGILARRNQLRDEGLTTEDPIIVWEPVPDLCIPSEKSNFIMAMRHIDVFSPNLEEFGALLDVSFDSLDGSINEDIFHSLATTCHSWLCASSDSIDVRRVQNSEGPSMIVRMGAHGSLFADKVGLTMIEPYQFSAETNIVGGDQKEAVNSSHKVVDPTGAGNAFLGGFCAGLSLPPVHEIRGFGTTNSQYLMAAVCGTVAASFAIEQIGLPVLSRHGSNGHQELWNNDSVMDRIQHMAGRARDTWLTLEWHSPMPKKIRWEPRP